MLVVDGVVYLFLMANLMASSKKSRLLLGIFVVVVFGFDW
jgi:hypothetical protein